MGDSMKLWMRIKSVIATVLPLSSCHVAAAMEAVVTAIEASPDGATSAAFHQLLQESIEICEGAYGDGVATWKRLTAARLETLDARLRSGVMAALAAVSKSMKTTEVHDGGSNA